MIFRRKKHDVPGLNTTSTADISFMLLIFFLVTTSMDSDKGMQRQMPPYSPDQQMEQRDVDRSKVLSLHLLKDGSLTIDGKPIDIKDVRRPLKEFFVKVGPTHIIELDTDRECCYDDYFALQNQIMRAYREIRNAAAKQRYNAPYSHCNADQRKSLQDLYPQRIQEVY